VSSPHIVEAKNKARDAVSRQYLGMLLIASAALSAACSGGQAQSADLRHGSVGAPARTADGKPDFSGIWQANTSADWDLLTHNDRPMVGQPGVYPTVQVEAAPVVALGTMGWVPADRGVVEGDEIPYQAWAAARKKENAEHWLDRDPELACYFPGVPRAMYSPGKFQIVQGPAKIMIVFEFRNAQRTINLDQVDQPPADLFMGHSVGRWEGDTLVVDVSHFTPFTWLSRSGDFHSDALHVVERYTPIGANAIQYEATLEDSKVFTRSWKISFPLYRRLEPDVQLVPFQCFEMTEETRLGHLRRRPLITDWKGKTMTVGVTRHMPPGDQVYETMISGNPPDPTEAK
jgi:hypothetical protein